MPTLDDLRSLSEKGDLAAYEWGWAALFYWHENIEDFMDAAEGDEKRAWYDFRAQICEASHQMSLYRCDDRLRVAKTFDRDFIGSIPFVGFSVLRHCVSEDVGEAKKLATWASENNATVDAVLAKKNHRKEADHERRVTLRALERIANRIERVFWDRQSFVSLAGSIRKAISEEAGND